MTLNAELQQSSKLSVFSLHFIFIFKGERGEWDESEAAET
jgi:hypothetical protein